MALVVFCECIPQRVLYCGEAYTRAIGSSREATGALTSDKRNEGVRIVAFDKRQVNLQPYHPLEQVPIGIAEIFRFDVEAWAEKTMDSTFECDAHGLEGMFRSSSSAQARKQGEGTILMFQATDERHTLEEQSIPRTYRSAVRWSERRSLVHLGTRPRRHNRMEERAIG